MDAVKNQPLVGSSLSGSYASDLDHIAMAVISARALVDQALAHIKKISSTEKGLSPALLDEQQLVSYETSFCVADLSAIEALLNYTQQVLERDELSGWVACQFGSESLKAVAGRLLARPADYGLTMATICASFETFDNTGIAAHYLSAKMMAALGRQLIDREGDFLPSDRKRVVN